jgi:hypothetical protein
MTSEPGANPQLTENGLVNGFVAGEAGARIEAYLQGIVMVEVALRVKDLGGRGRGIVVDLVKGSPAATSPSAQDELHSPDVGKEQDIPHDAGSIAQHGVREGGQARLA